MNKTNSDHVLLKNSILPFVESGKLYCIGLSGGSDSILLLNFLKELSISKKFRVVALHLNHSLRNHESDGDASFCEKVCEELEIEIIAQKIDVKKFAAENKLSIEDAARKCRYNFFTEICGKLNANAVFTAHHADDQAETVLLRLFRGTGLKGLTGMKKTTFFNELKLVRPWLNIPRSILDGMINEMELNYRYDS